MEFSWYLELISYLREKHPGIDLDCFSPIEIEGIAEVCGLSTFEVLKQLKKAGMHGLPGGGAEMLVEEVRSDVSPKKGSPKNWLKVMGEAQSLGLITSATNVIGFGETNRQRVLHLEELRKLQDYSLENHGIGFTSFIAWPVQLETNSFGRRNRGNNKFELGAGIMNICDMLQFPVCSWIILTHSGIKCLIRRKDSSDGTVCWSNDAGSTMMEENVVSASGTSKFSATEVELQNLIKRSGFKPVRRNSRYEYLDTPSLVELENMPSNYSFNY